MAVDKLILKTEQEIQFNLLRSKGFSIRTIRNGGYFHSIYEVLSPVSIPGRKRLAEHKIIIYKHKEYSKIQLNPNHFSSFASVELLVGLLVRDLSEPHILQTDFEVVLRKISFDSLKVQIGFRNSRVFQRITKFDNRSSSKLPSTTIDFENPKYAKSFYFGSRKSDQLVTYERIKWIPFWPDLSSRIKDEGVRVEIRFKQSNRVRFSEARSYWPTIEPFQRVTFYEYESLNLIKAQHRAEVELFRYKAQESSPKESEDWFKRNVTLTNHARFKRRLSKVRNEIVRKHGLHERFAKNLQNFLNAKPSRDEELWLR